MIYQTNSRPAAPRRQRPPGAAPTVSVVIPTLNEGPNLQHVLPRIPAWVHEVIIVDGRSADDTITTAQALLPAARIVLEPRKGKGVALRTGFLAATGEVIVMLDADGSMDPTEIPAFVAALVNGADFVKGSRFLRGGGTTDMSLLRQTGNAALTALVRFLYRCDSSDLCYGFMAFWSRDLPLLRADVDGFEIETLLNLRALQARMKVTEVPSFEAERVHGISNLRTFPDGWRVLTTILRERFLGSKAVAPNAGDLIPNPVVSK